MLKSINPYDGKEIYRTEEFTEDQVEKLIHASHKAFKKWQQTDFASRASLLAGLASSLRNKSREFGMVITREMGKPIRESIAEVEKCAWVCDYYADNAAGFLGEEVIETDADHSYVRYEPIGVVLAVMPWNFPLWQVFRFAAPALMAGNAALLKHASSVQMSAKIIQDVFIDAGFPANLFLNLPVSSKKVEKIIRHPLVRAVTLTGSEGAGSAVASQAGSQIKKTVLELGGSNAFMVFEDADLERAVETGLKARMQNAGQSCIAAKRFLVHQHILEAFVLKMKSRMDQMVMGDPTSENTDIGPLSSVEQAMEVERQVHDSLKEGAEIVRGGNRKGAFFEPTMVINIKPDMPVWREEVFGPVMPVMAFSDLDEAVEMANDTTFGLGATVFTRSADTMQKITPLIEDGAVFFNDLVKSDPRLPFGGTKRSGYGRELSMHGIREFVNIKTVYIRK